MDATQIVLKVPGEAGRKVTLALPGMSLEAARAVAPYLQRGCAFARVVEEVLEAGEQTALPGVGGELQAPVVVKKPRYRGDDKVDTLRLLEALRSSGSWRSSGDLEAGTGIPASVVRRLLHGHQMITEVGVGRATKYRANLSAQGWPASAVAAPEPEIVAAEEAIDPPIDCGRVD